MPNIIYNRRLNAPIAASSLDADYLAWRSAVGSVGATQETATNALIVSLKAHSLWTGYDRIWLLAAENSTQALTCIKSLSVATNNGATFTASQGYAGDAATTYINTGFSPSNGVNYLQNSASIFAYIRTNRTSTSNKSVVGSVETASFGVYSRLETYSNSSAIVYPVNNDGSNPFDQFTSLAGTAQGAWTSSRTGGTTLDIYRNSNSTSLNTSSGPSNSNTALVAVNFYICGTNADGTLARPSDDQISIVALGGGQSGASAALAQADFNTYMTALGSNVY